MKKKYLLTVLLFSILISSIQGQVVKRDSKIRLGFGLAGFTSNSVNSLIYTFEELAKEMYPETGFSPSHFKKHLFYTIEYEVDINHDFNYMFTFEIHKDRISGSDVNYVNYVSQYINFDFNYITGGVAIVYYYPFFTTKFGEARIFAGLGMDLLYTNLDIYHYYNEVTKDGPQEIDYNATGYNISGKGFFGVEVPFSHAIFIQVRGGFAYREASDFSGKIRASQQKPINPEIMDKKSYNLSGFSGDLGIAFYF
ncbi:hypothetical protein ACFLSX_01270 [Calditrichota bacterium]